MVVMRSISLYGLSDIRLTFDEGTDNYFARQVIFQRIGDAQLPSGVTPSMAPLFSPSGLVYRYVLESPDRTPQELKTIEDWVVERAYKAVPGVADDSGLGWYRHAIPGAARSCAAVWISPDRAAVVQALSVNNANAGGGFYSQGGQFYYVRGLGLVQNTERYRQHCHRQQKGTPIRIRDVGDVDDRQCSPPGKFGFQTHNRKPQRCR